MADEDRLADAEPLHQRGDRRCLAGRRLVAAAALRPAMAGPVEEQHLGAAFEQGPQRHHLILQIGAGAVDEDDRRQLGIGRRRHVDEMHAACRRHRRSCRPADCGARSARRRPRAAGEGEDQGQQESERGGEEVHAQGVRSGAELVQGRSGFCAASLRIKCLRRPALPTAWRPRSGRCASSDRWRAPAARLRAPICLWPVSFRIWAMPDSAPKWRGSSCQRTVDVGHRLAVVVHHEMHAWRGGSSPRHSRATASSPGRGNRARRRISGSPWPSVDHFIIRSMEALPDSNHCCQMRPAMRSAAFSLRSRFSSANSLSRRASRSWDRRCRAAARSPRPVRWLGAQEPSCRARSTDRAGKRQRDCACSGIYSRDAIVKLNLA